MRLSPPELKNENEIVELLELHKLYSPQIQKAMEIAKVAHKGQIRRDETPYIQEHIWGIVEELVKLYEKDPNIEEMLILGILHDVIEDSNKFTIEDIASNFGEKISIQLEALTNSPEDNSHSLSEEKSLDVEKHKLVKLKAAGRCSCIIKLADFYNNLYSVRCNKDIKRLPLYIRKGRKFFIPFAAEINEEKFKEKIEEELKLIEEMVKLGDFEIIKINKEDGVDLYGELYLRNPNPKKCIVLSHGLRIDCHEDGAYDSLVSNLLKNNWNVFRFDYTGHGLSDGNHMDYSLTKAEEDLEAVFKHLEDIGFGEFAIVSASFSGGPVTFFTARNNNKVKALVYWNSLIDYWSRRTPIFDKYKGIWGKDGLKKAREIGYMDFGGRKANLSLKFMEEVWVTHPELKLSEIKCPILFIHGDLDEHVPLEDSIKYSKMLENSELKIIKGSAHGFHNENHQTEASTEVVKFLNKCKWN